MTVALPAFLGAQAAPAAPRITPVRGDVRALAFGGDALVVARQPAEALAFPSEGADAAAGVMAGPAAGPLRESPRARPACSCRRSRSTARGSPGAKMAAASRRSARAGVAPSVIAVDGADPAVPPRRSPVTGQGLLSALALVPGDAGLAGLLLPSFFALDSEVRPFGPTGIGAPIVAEQGRRYRPAAARPGDPQKR